MSFLSDKSPEECWEYFDRHLALIPNEENRREARQFLLEKEESGKLSTVGGYLGHIKPFGIYLADRPWRDATRDDVILHIKGATGKQGRVERTYTGRGRPLGKYTKYQRMVMLRQFYKWLLDTDETPDQFRRMPFRKPTSEEQEATLQDRATQDEVISLLSATEDKRDRAIVMTLVDGGFREGELVAFNNGDAVFDDYGAKLQHQSDAGALKTGIRKVPTRITFAAPYLKDWMGVHPHRRDAAWPLFTSRSNRNFGERLTGRAIWDILDRLCRRAKIRHINPHMLRHTSASIRSGDGWNEEMMRLHFGWRKGSKMPSHYSHVQDKYDAFALRRAGFPVKESPKEVWTNKCAECERDNALDAIYCGGCGRRVLDD